MRTDVATEPAQPLHLLQLTDPHLFASADGSLRGTVTEQSLLRVLAHVSEAGWPADLVTVTGDLIQDDTREAYRRFRRHFDDFGLPVLCVPGNHDVPELMRDELAAKPYLYCGSIERNNWLVLGLDSFKAGSAGGVIEAAELDRMRATIEASSADHVLLCLHHPPLPMHSKWLDTVGLDNGEEFLEAAAASGRVRACLFGHVHQAFDEDWNGIRILGTPSTCSQFLPGSDEFAIDNRPPAYRRVTLTPDGRLDDKLIWVETARSAA